MPNTNDIALLIISGLQKNPKVRFWAAMISGFLTLATALLFFSAELFIPSIAVGIRQLIPILIVAFGFTFVLALASYAPIDVNKIKSGDFDVASIREERKEIKRRISQSPKDVVGTIQLSLNQLTEYYAINKNQARNSFGWSIFAIILGLITIISGVWIFFLQTNSNIQVATITSLAGILAEFIGAAYFYLYVKSINQLNFFFAQLIRLQDTMLAIKLMEDIKDDNKQDEMRKKLITAIMSRPIDGKSFIEKVDNTSQENS